MSMSNMKFSFAEVVMIVTFVISISTAWYDLHSDVVDLKKDMRLLRGQVQWLLGEGIKYGWIPPLNNTWEFPYDDK